MTFSHTFTHTYSNIPLYYVAYVFTIRVSKTGQHVVCVCVTKTPSKEQQIPFSELHETLCENTLKQQETVEMMKKNPVLLNCSRPAMWGGRRNCTSNADQDRRERLHVCARLGVKQTSHHDETSSPTHPPTS